MANGKGAGGVSWTILFAGGAVLMSLTSGLWSVVNPKGDLGDLKKEVADFKWQVSQEYIRKDVARKDIDFTHAAIVELKASKVDRDLYEQRVSVIDNRAAVQRTRIDKISEQITAKDAIKLMQDQISELQRVVRTAPTK